MKAFWGRVSAGWGDTDLSGEATCAPPGGPAAWRVEDPSAADALGRDLDGRAVDAVRRRALDGDAPALTLCFRASRGMARPVDMTPPPSETEALPPEVAAAMIEAGLRAAGCVPG